MTSGPIIPLEALLPTPDNGCHVVGIYIVIIVVIIIIMITMTVIKRSVRSIPLRE